MPNKFTIALVGALTVVTAAAGLATDAFAANNYDSSDWAPMYAGLTVGGEPRAGAYEKNAEKSAPRQRWQLSHRTGIDRPR
jgi:hypothetical protein